MGDESNSNYMQLLKLCGEDDSGVFQWIKKKTDKYTSGDMQNEMKVMALQVLQEVASSIHSASFVTLMVDETTMMLQIVSKLYCVFVGLMLTLKSIIGLFMVDAAKVRGQCYDGAATMSGKNAGIVAKD